MNRSPHVVGDTVKVEADAVENVHVGRMAQVAPGMQHTPIRWSWMRPLVLTAAHRSLARRPMRKGSDGRCTILTS
jgi:hypothetical protein